MWWRDANELNHTGDISLVIRSCAGDKDEEQHSAHARAGAHRHLRVCMARLCYDAQPVEAMPFPVAMPDKTSWVLS
jgi:hypothetical protein